MLQAAEQLRLLDAIRQHPATEIRWWQPGACQQTAWESAQQLLALEQVQECWMEPAK